MIDLTKKQKEVLRYILEGKTAVEISEMMFITTYGVQFHIDNLHKRFEVTTKAHLFRRCLELGYMEIIEKKTIKINI